MSDEIAEAVTTLLTPHADHPWASCTMGAAELCDDCVFDSAVALGRAAETADIEARISAAVAAERETCAKVAEETPCRGDESWWAAETAIAAAIRARGAK